MGKTRRATDQLRQLLADDPNDAEAHGLLALNLFDAHDHKGAREHATACLKIDPEQELGHLAAGLEDVLIKDTKSARAHLTAVVQQDPNNEGIGMLVGFIKARENPFMGLWWQWNRIVSFGPWWKRILGLLLIGVPMILILNVFWWLFVLYHWTGIFLFRRMIAKEKKLALGEF